MKIEERRKFREAVNESIKNKKSVVSKLKPSGEAAKREEEARTLNSKMKHRISKEVGRQLSKILTDDVFPHELREIYGESWYDEARNALIQDLIAETENQTGIVFLATTEMLQNLEKAKITFADGTWDLSSSIYKVGVIFCYFVSVLF